MASVYQAKQLDLDRIVAIKIIESVTDADESLAQRLQREALALSNLRHKNIMAFYAFGVYSGRPYLVEEYADGVTLEALLKQEGPLSATRAMAIIEQVCDGIAHAHQNGVIHRDLKPANILLCRDAGAEVVRVIDFGLVKLMPDFGQDIQKLTKTGWSVGSIHYMSPEQCRGRTVTEQADIYAIGAILHQCLTGVPPFDLETDLLIMSAHIGMSPPTVAAVRTDAVLPPSLQDLIFKALAKNSEERYQSVSDLQSDLHAIQSGRAVKIKSPFAANGDRQYEAKAAPRKLVVVPQLVRVFILFLLLAGGFSVYRRAADSGAFYKGKTAKQLYDIDWAAADRRPLVSATDYTVSLLKKIIERNREDQTIKQPGELVDVYVSLAARQFQMGKLKDGWATMQEPWFRGKVVSSPDNPRRNLLLEAGACARLHYSDSIPITTEIRGELEKLVEQCRATDTTYPGLPFVANELAALDNFVGVDKRTLDHDFELLAWVDGKGLNSQVGWWNLGRAYQTFPSARLDCMKRALAAAKKAGDDGSTLPTLAQWFATEAVDQMQSTRSSHPGKIPVPLSDDEKELWTACLECTNLSDRIAGRDAYMFAAYTRLGETAKAKSLEHVKHQFGLPAPAQKCMDACAVID